MNIFDKLKLPFAKKVKQVPVSWVEEGPEHYYVIHHLLFGYSDSTSVPNGYADIFSDAEVHDVLEKARKAVSDMNLSVSSAKALDRITELKAARFSMRSYWLGIMPTCCLHTGFIPMYYIRNVKWSPFSSCGNSSCEKSKKKLTN